MFQSRSTSDIAGLAFWLGFAVLGFALTFGFDGDIANYRYGAGGWPRMLFALMALVAVVQFVVAKRAPQAAVADAAPAAGLPLRLVAMPLIYIALLKPVGFFVMTPLFLAGVMWAMGERRPLPILAATGVIYALVVVVFVKLLYVPLPIGTLPGFYDVGNWLLGAVR